MSAEKALASFIGGGGLRFFGPEWIGDAETHYSEGLRGFAASVIGLGVGCVACGGERYVPTPPFTADASAVLYVFEPLAAGGARQMFAAPVGPPSLELELTGDADSVGDVWALGFSRRLDELHLEDGWVTLPTLPADGRAPPAPTSVHRRMFEADGAWRDGSLDELVGFVLPAADWQACSARGGCRRSADDGEFCTTPCPSIEAPRPPSLDERPIEGPQLTPCPTGWSEIPAGDDLEPAHCEPFPLGDETPCGADEVRLPGGPGCERLGDECPAGPWPLVVPSGVAVLYVLPGAPPGGDGSVLDPFGTFADAYAVAPAGAVIAVGKGELAEPLRIERDITVHGACVAQTRLVGSTAIAISVGAGTLRMSNLSISASVVALRSLTDGVVSLEDVAISGPGGIGQPLVNARGLRFEAYHVSIRGGAGGGLALGAGVHAVLDAVSVSQVGESGVIIEGGRTLASLRRVVIDDSEGRSPADEIDPGLDVRIGATATVTQSVVTRAHGHGVRVSEDSWLTLEDVVVRRVGPDPEQNRFGEGVATADRAILNARRLWVEGVSLVGVRVQDDSSVQLEDVLIQNVAADADNNDGHGVHCSDTASVTAVRLMVLRSHESGIELKQACTARIRDLQVHHVAQAGSRTQSSGVLMQGGELDLERAVIGQVGVGINVLGPGGAISVRDVRLFDTSDTGMFSASVGPKLDRVRMEGGEGVGIYLLGALGASIRDLEIRGLRGTVGGCLSIDACDGTALSADADATVEVLRFAFTNNRGSAVRSGTNTAVALEDGLVAGNGTALFVTDPNAQLPPLFTRVEYRDNGVFIRR